MAGLVRPVPRHRPAGRAARRRNGTIRVQVERARRAPTRPTAGGQPPPATDVVFTDVHSGRSSTGAIGLGEPATVPTAAAIANAVAHATGVRMLELPLTPEGVLAALGSVS